MGVLGSHHEAVLVVLTAAELQLKVTRTGDHTAFQESLKETDLLMACTDVKSVLLPRSDSFTGLNATVALAVARPSRSKPIASRTKTRSFILRV